MIFCNSVYALIDHGGKLLVVRTHSTGLWGFPGGGIEPGEPLTEALAREVREKTGITVKKGMPTRVNGLKRTSSTITRATRPTTPVCSFIGARRFPRP
ncbi:MAG: NUDIX domain-containing protein [Chloroflexota bacterium]|nr:NUDIX domain-containing protein [Chloroflexota bacterium]